MIEEQYRELAEHARNKFIELESKYNKEKLKYHELKKEFLSAYGMVRIIDSNLDEIDGIESSAGKVLLELLRSHMSDTYDKIVCPEITTIMIELQELNSD
tara:strand:+ start:5481 stop:5780 length:300 start_codon:yes stop_codon:yes gene_type:complete